MTDLKYLIMENVIFPPTVLPDGSLAHVTPYHFCTKGEESKILFRDSEDFRVAHNFIPICAHRANVTVAADCVLGSHVHCGILARNYADAVKFSNSYKISTSMFLVSKYGSEHGCSFREIESKPLPVDSFRYFRNMVCYILKNALDMGEAVDAYCWSSFRSLFRNGRIPVTTTAVKNLKYREARACLKSRIAFDKVPWLLNSSGVIEPASYCDWKYVERLFRNDQSFFLKCLGMTDNAQMDQLLVINPTAFLSCEELLKEIEQRSHQRYGKPVLDLTVAQKIPLIKSVFFSFRTSKSQLARCFGLKKEEVARILGSI